METPTPSLSDNNQVAPPTHPAADPAAMARMAALQRKTALQAKVRSGVNWFYFIAGLSLVNSVIHMLGSNTSFVVGLGSAQFVDAVSSGIAERMTSNGFIILIIGFLIDLFLAGIFVLAGFFGNKGYSWMIIGGMIFYALDTILCVLFEMWLGLAFHAWALFGIWNGLMALNQLKALEKQEAQPSLVQVL